MFVIKRDGTQQKFNRRKIHKAILSAWDSIAPGLVPDLTGIVNSVVLIIDNQKQNEMAIETIQDIVEDVLIGWSPEVAKHYIHYRRKRAEVREAALGETIDGSVLADYKSFGMISEQRLVILARTMGWVS